MKPLFFLLIFFAIPFTASAADISECTTTGGGFFSEAYPDIQCSCPNAISARDYSADVRLPRASVNDCITGCRQLKANNSGRDIVGYTVECKIAATGETEIIAQGSLTGEQALHQKSDCDENSIACACPTYGNVARVAELGQQADTIEGCVQICQLFRDNNPAEIKNITEASLTCEVNNLFVTLETVSLGVPGLPTGTTQARDIIFPNLGVSIPGFDPKDPSSYRTENGQLQSNILGLYIAAIYRFLLAAGALIAVVMIMIAGLQWMLAAGNAGKISAARERMASAIFGLVLLFAAYTIAYWISPATTRFKSLNLVSIQREELPPQGEHEIESPAAPGAPLDARDFVKPDNDNIVLTSGDIRISKEVNERLVLAATDLKQATGKKIKLTSGVRSVEYQLGIYYDKCVGSGQTKCSTGTCNPIWPKTEREPLLSRARKEAWSRDKFINEALPKSNANVCPHTIAVAVDVWCDPGNWTGYRFDTACQAALTKVMQKHGFCRLNIEPWHFELDAKKGSTNSCSITQDEWTYKDKDTGEIYNVQNCTKWDAKNHKCVTQ